MPRFPYEDAVRVHVENKFSDSIDSLLSIAAFDVPTSHVIRGEAANWFVEARKVLTLTQVPNESVALIDTTTLRNAIAILFSQRDINDVPAGAILDAGTFVNAYVFEDALMYLDPRGPDTADPAKGIETAALPADAPLRAIQWRSSEMHSKVLTHLWDRAESFTSAICQHPEWQPVLQQYWSTVLGADVPKDFYVRQAAFRTYFSSISSMAMEQGVVDRDRYHNWSALPYDEWLGLQNRFAAESTVRAVFCQLYACSTGTVYHANAYRAQVRNLLSDRFRQDASTINGSMIDFLQKHFWGAAAGEMKELLGTEPVEFPFVMLAVLSDASTGSEVLERLSELREKASPFRARRTELTEAFIRGDVASLGALKRAVTADARAFANLKQLAGKSAILRGILTVGGARPILGALGSVAANFLKLPDDVKAIVRARMVRPEIWTLTHLAAEAREGLQVLPSLVKLLGKRGYRPDPREYGQVERELQRLTEGGAPPPPSPKTLWDKPFQATS